jgi:hypothetical protein
MPKTAPTRKNITVTIKDSIPSQNPAKADPGNTVTFLNMDTTEKVLRFAVDANGTEFHPIGLMLPPGPDGAATIIAVDPKNGKSSTTAFYTISTVQSDGGFAAGPDDDTYQVIVGSGGNENR